MSSVLIAIFYFYYNFVNYVQSLLENNAFYYITTSKIILNEKFEAIISLFPVINYYYYQ